jgi:hypothetical protein
MFKYLQNSVSFKAAVFCITALVALPQQAHSAPDDSDFCTEIADLRTNYSVLNRGLAVATVQNNPDQIEDWDIEDDSCISDYGVNVGLSFTSIASSLLDSLADAACSALDNFIGNQLSALGSSVTAPIDMGQVDVGFQQQDAPFSYETSREAITVDYEQAFNDRLNELPEVGGSFGDANYSDGQSVNDFDYLGTRPQYDGDRR